MYDSIRRVIAAVCVTATLIQPALASAQSFSLEPSGPSIGCIRPADDVRVSLAWRNHFDNA